MYMYTLTVLNAIITSWVCMYAYIPLQKKTILLSERITIQEVLHRVSETMATTFTSHIHYK